MSAPVIDTLCYADFSRWKRGMVTNTQKEDWKTPLRSWVEYSHDTRLLVALTKEGLSRVHSMPKLMTILGSEEGDISVAKARADEAAKEIEGNFPKLHAHSLLGLWGAFESMVEDLFIARLSDHPALLNSEAFERIKIPVSLIATASDSELHRSILDATSRNLNETRGAGITPFEGILRMVNLAGSVPGIVRDAVFEAQQIRNVWAHRGGRADPHFQTSCPSLGFALGDVVALNAEQFNRLSGGLDMYGIIILNRIQDERSEKRAEVDIPGFEGVLDEVPLSISPLVNQDITAN